VPIRRGRSTVASVTSSKSGVGSFSSAARCLVRTLSIAVADAADPDPTKRIPRCSRIRCSAPSSPNVP